ncbi:uncharacterized protein LOC106174599 isoform X2 [Lingula anatina]|uniref:Uncharacterized protein LOC106174599 isoform X1 n=1 Tax=Lingula anatina TaxID=7574 RepID=A0A1S3JMT6_LINAN|nr:uncharacterized protein LOC106174599 isoform X1 [Lingula anatina]XP_013411683.1 uncharacterized protein LOC106174599 isoform X2 [Lingula anatina]|eukprot:XP_013411682.1 uncharacterized protein LOC106174599 isoform X1 [Lingula anatina]
MGKESDFLKAVKASDVEKIEKLYNPSSGSIMRKKDKHFPTTEELLKTNQIIHLRHLNVNCQEEDSGYTPLIIAVLNGNHEISASLIRHGADINGQDFKGNTALHMATFNGRSDLVDMLLAAGAKVNKLNLDGNTPLHIACQAFTQGKLMLILKMLKAGANPVIKNKAGDTALDITAMFNRQEAASALLDHEPKLKENTSAIVGAAIRGSSEIVQLLLDYGVNPNGICIKQRTRPLHEAVRYERWETVKILLSYGADPLMQNDKGQTAESIALQCGNEKASKFISMFKEYENRPKDTPRFLKLENLPLSPVEEGLVPRYPLLDNKISWTRNTEEYCNNCTALHNNTNLLDNNPCSFWVIPATHHAWVVFDLEHEHTLTGMRILGWESPQMPKTVELQKANSLRGRWQTVTSFNVKQKGSQSPKDPCVPQDFLGFCSTSRYWRFHILDNHGGPCTCFQGIQFYGIDARVLSFFEQLGLMQYAEEFIKKGYNCYDSLLNVHPTDLEKMVPSEMHRRQISVALKDLKLKVYPIRRLAWLKSPVNMAREGETLPPFTVQSDPEVSEEVSLFVHGKAEVKGRTTVSLVPQGPRYPSTATFEGIEIYPAGRYLIEVHCTRFPQLSLQAPQHIEIVQRAKDPSEVTAAFDELEDMLRSMQASLGESLNGNS